MNYKAVSATLALVALITLSPRSDSRSFAAQDKAPAPKAGFTVVPYYHSRYRRGEGCPPVEVKAVSIGAVPPEVLTSQVVIESFSEKPVAAVKLRWDVYSRGVGLKKNTARCDAPPVAADIYLSGATPLIQVGHLVEGEVYNITSDPRLTFPGVAKTITVDRPIISWDEVKGLTLDGTRATFKGDYAAVMYVSEVQFDDGTKWEGGVK